MQVRFGLTSNVSPVKDDINSGWRLLIGNICVHQGTSSSLSSPSCHCTPTRVGCSWTWCGQDHSRTNTRSHPLHSLGWKFHPAQPPPLFLVCKRLEPDLTLPNNKGVEQLVLGVHWQQFLVVLNLTQNSASCLPIPDQGNCKSTGALKEVGDLGHAVRDTGVGWLQYDCVSNRDNTARKFQ